MPLFGGWQASLTDTLRCVSHKIDERLPSVASHTGQQYLCYAENGLNKHVAVSATLTFATPQAAYANPLRSANFYIMQDRYAQCSRPKSIAHKGHYAKVGWQCPPTRVAKRGSVMSLRGLSPDSLATLALRGTVRSLRGVFVLRQPFYADKDNSTQ